MGLSGRIGHLSLEGGNISVLLQNYEKRKEGALLQLDVSNNGRAIDKLRQLVSKQEQCEPARVRFYMYADGSVHRTHINGDSMLFASWPIRTSPLFYSVVEQGQKDPPSPEEEIRKIKEKIQEVRSEYDRKIQEVRSESDRKIQESDLKIQEVRLESDRKIQEVRSESDRKIQEVQSESDRKIQEVRSESDRGIRRLEMNSSTAGIRDRVFSECVEVSFEDWKKRLGNEGGDYSHMLAQICPNAQCKIIRNGKNQTCSDLKPDKEDVVQAFFVRFFLALGVGVCDLSQNSPLLHPQTGSMQKIDIATFVLFGQHGQTWELLDMCVELKLNLTRAELRDAACEVFERAVWCFEKQPERQYFDGLSMDLQNVCFVRVHRDYSWSRTPLLPLWQRFAAKEPVVLAEAGLAMVRMMKQPPELHGFVPVVLPTLFRQTAIACLHRSSSGVAVFQLSDQECCKVGADLTAEIAFMKMFENSVLQVFPRLIECGVSGDNVFRHGFRMELCDLVVNEVLRGDLSIEAVVGSVFWSLYLLHEGGVVHNDVKPSNILVTRGNRVILSDAGSAFEVSSKRPTFRGCTEAFNVTGTFSQTNDDAKYWDMEGLLWTALYLVMSKSAGKAFSYRHWNHARYEQLFRYEQLVKPIVMAESSLLRDYFHRAIKLDLLGPETCVSAIGTLNCDNGFDLFVIAVRELESLESLFECPDVILRRIFLRERN